MASSDVDDVEAMSLSELRRTTIVELNDEARSTTVVAAGLNHDDCLEKKQDLQQRASEALDMIGVDDQDVDVEDESVRFAVTLSTVTCAIPSISCFLHSDEWHLATVGFFERFCRAFADGTPRTCQEVYRAFRLLIEQLIQENLMQLADAPDLGTLALFCELIGSSDLLDGWVDPNIAEQAKLMLLVQDEASFANLMRDYMSITEHDVHPEDDLLDAVTSDVFGFAKLFPQGTLPLQGRSEWEGHRDSWEGHREQQQQEQQQRRRQLQQQQPQRQQQQQQQQQQQRPPQVVAFPAMDQPSRSSMAFAQMADCIQMEGTFMQLRHADGSDSLHGNLHGARRAHGPAVQTQGSCAQMEDAFMQAAGPFVQTQGSFAQMEEGSGAGEREEVTVAKSPQRGADGARGEEPLARAGRRSSALFVERDEPTGFVAALAQARSLKMTADGSRGTVNPKG